MSCVSEFIAMVAFAVALLGGFVFLIGVVIELATYHSQDKVIGAGFVIAVVAVGILFVAAVVKVAELALSFC